MPLRVEKKKAVYWQQHFPVPHLIKPNPALPELTDTPGEIDGEICGYSVGGAENVCPVSPNSRMMFSLFS